MDTDPSLDTTIQVGSYAAAVLRSNASLARDERPADGQGKKGAILSPTSSTPSPR